MPYLSLASLMTCILKIAMGNFFFLLGMDMFRTLWMHGQFYLCFILMNFLSIVLVWKLMLVFITLGAQWSVELPYPTLNGAFVGIYNIHGCWDSFSFGGSNDFMQRLTLMKMMYSYLY